MSITSSWRPARGPLLRSPSALAPCSSSHLPGLSPPSASRVLPLPTCRWLYRALLCPLTPSAVTPRLLTAPHPVSTLASIRGSRQPPEPRGSYSELFSSPGCHPDCPNLGHHHTILQIRNPGVLGHLSLHPQCVLWDPPPRVHIRSLCSTSTSVFIAGFIPSILAFLNSSACQSDLSRREP